MSNTRIFGIKIETGSREELLKKCAALIGRGGAISTVNPEILKSALDDAELKGALKESLCIPDGIGVERVIKRSGVYTERFPGVELGEELLEIREVKLGLVGGRAGVAERAMQELVMRHKNVIPEFAVSGYGINEASFVSELKEKKPDIVFVCLGSPKQETFIMRMKEHAPRTLFVALGGSLDVYSKDKKRAPLIFRKIGCEWLWRVINEPNRIKRLPKTAAFFRAAAKNQAKRVKICKKRTKRIAFFHKSIEN